MDMSKYILAYILFCFISFETIAQVSCGSEETFTGEGTYYDIAQFGNFGNCSIENEVFTPFLIGAMNASQYGAADYCGACAEVTGPNGSVKIHIIDQCPECAPGDIDLSPEAFDLIADRIDGRVDISWEVVPCEVRDSPIQFYFKEGSNQWWNAVQIRNHKNRLAKVEYWDGSQYKNIGRQDYNFFLNASGLGVGPFTFRVTDVYGNQIVESDIPFVLTTELEGKNQFPDCDPVGVNNESLDQLNFIQSENKIIFLDTDNQFDVLSLSGKSILKGSTSINQIDLNTGFYFLKISDDRSIKTDKIFIP